MYGYNNTFYDPYRNRLGQMEQQQNAQPIQRIVQPTPQSQCYFVSSKSEMQNIQPAPNTIYIGLNQQNKEVYLKSWNNDGNIDFDTYTLFSGEKEATDSKLIMTKLQEIEEKLNERIVAKLDTASNVGPTEKQSANGDI